jgi:hypothetical protein
MPQLATMMAIVEARCDLTGFVVARTIPRIDSQTMKRFVLYEYAGRRASGHSLEAVELRKRIASRFRTPITENLHDDPDPIALLIQYRLFGALSVAIREMLVHARPRQFLTRTLEPEQYVAVRAAIGVLGQIACPNSKLGPDSAICRKITCLSIPNTGRARVMSVSRVVA